MVLYSSLVLNFSLGSGDDVVDSLSNVVNFSLSIQVLPDLIISLYKLLELLLQAIVLVIQISHVFIKCIDLSLEVNLILKHLIRVLFKSINFVTH